MLNRSCIGIGALAILVAALAAVSTGALRAEAARTDKSPVVTCWNKNLPGAGPSQYRRTPSRCLFLKRGEVALAFSVNVESLRWRNWGGKRAVGVGKTCSAMSNTCSRVEVTLDQKVLPSNRCSRTSIRRLTSTTRTATTAPDMPLYTC